MAHIVTCKFCRAVIPAGDLCPRCEREIRVENRPCRICQTLVLVSGEAVDGIGPLCASCTRELWHQRPTTGFDASRYDSPPVYDRLRRVKPPVEVPTDWPGLFALLFLAAVIAIWCWKGL